MSRELTGWAPEHRERFRRAGRRSAGWFGLAVVFVVLSVPAIFDLKSLFVGLAVLTAVLGVATALFTWFDRAPQR